MPRHAIAKLVPPRSNRIVRRTRVLAAIDRGLRAGACWITAPGGYGKTIAISDYLQKKRVPSVWYRVDEGDQDVASFFHYMTLSVRGARGGVLPTFGPEYADQLLPFARRFFRAYLSKLRPGTLLVLDDLHNADVSHFRQILGVLLHELPPAVRCACVSRTLPQDDLLEPRVKGRLSIVDESVLRFSDREARALLKMRLAGAVASINVTPVCGWAAGLVLLAERASASAQPEVLAPHTASTPVAFAALAGQVIDGLPRAERELLMKLSLLPEVSPRSSALSAASAPRTPSSTPFIDGSFS